MNAEIRLIDGPQIQVVKGKLVRAGSYGCHEAPTKTIELRDQCLTKGQHLFVIVMDHVKGDWR